MVKALFDANVLLDCLQGTPAAAIEIARYGETAISIITRMEVLVGARADQEGDVRQFLEEFETIPLGDQCRRESGSASENPQVETLRRDHLGFSY